MNLLLVADLHYALKQFDWILSVAADHDAVVIAGDLLEVASVVPQDAQIVVVEEYLRRLSALTRVLVCSGNHDLDSVEAGGERIAGWLASLGVAGVVRDGEAVEVGDTLISCFPWWDGPQAQGRIAEQMARDAAVRRGDWIWVYHAPPGNSAVSWGGKRSYGDAALNGWIDEHRPSLVLSGHVHQAPFVSSGSWVDRIGGTWVFNMGQQPGEAPARIVIDTRAGEAVWFSLEGRERISLSSQGVETEALTELPGWLRAGGQSSP